jgi:small subunit ribosomal protein S6
MAAVYDLMLLLDPGVPDEQRAKILADAESAITSQGTLVGKHDWGRRALAYEIQHRDEAEYHLFQFNATPALLESLQRTLKLTDGVVRFRLIKLAPGTPEPPQARPPEPPRVETADHAAAEEAAPVEAAPAKEAPAEAAPSEAAPAEGAPAEAAAPAEPASAEEAPAAEPAPAE